MARVTTQTPTPVGGISGTYSRANPTAFAVPTESTPETVTNDSIITLKVTLKAATNQGVIVKVKPEGGVLTTVLDVRWKQVEQSVVPATFFVPRGGTWEWEKDTAAPEGIEFSKCELT